MQNCKILFSASSFMQPTISLRPKQIALSSPNASGTSFSRFNTQNSPLKKHGSLFKSYSNTLAGHSPSNRYQSVMKQRLVTMDSEPNSQLKSPARHMKFTSIQSENFEEAMQKQRIQSSIKPRYKVLKINMHHNHSLSLTKETNLSGVTTQTATPVRSKNQLNPFYSPMQSIGNQANNQTQQDIPPKMLGIPKIERPKSSLKRMSSPERVVIKHIQGNQNRSVMGQRQQISPLVVNKKVPVGYQQGPELDVPKCSIKGHGVVAGYAANTHDGLVRNYNEDRVSIILNIMRPSSLPSQADWPNCSFFGVYDGHGGARCADFLRDNLHQYIIKDREFPANPIAAIENGFAMAEKTFLTIAQEGEELERSGSCAIIVLIINEICYVANVGDSRVILCSQKGNKIAPLSRDHKPTDKDEQKRIIAAGGKVYQSQMPQVSYNYLGTPIANIIYGPVRVLPGKLSVCRTFGDFEAKLLQYGGNPHVVIAKPEIHSFKIDKENDDFIVLASDGVFDKLSNEDVSDTAWKSTNEKQSTIHQYCGGAVDALMQETFAQESLDNITVVMIALPAFKYALLGGEQNLEESTEPNSTISNRPDTRSSISKNIKSVIPSPLAKLNQHNSTLMMSRTPIEKRIGNSFFKARERSKNHLRGLSDHSDVGSDLSYSTLDKSRNK